MKFLAPNIEEESRRDNIRGGIRCPNLSIHWGLYESLLLFAFFSTLIAFQIRDAYLRPFWFDEISTMVVASQPTLSSMFRAIPYDGNPPLYFLLARLSLNLPLHAEIAVRLPAIFAFDIAILLAYVFVRRHAAPIFGFISISFLCANYLAIYLAITARPYPLILFFAAIAICSWQSLALGGRRTYALIGIGVSMAGAILSHQYGAIYIGLPIAAAEATEMLREKRFRYGVMLALVFGAIPAAFTVPITLRIQAPLLGAIRRSESFGNRPGLHCLAEYVQFIPHVTFFGVLASVACGISLLTHAVRQSERSRWRGNPLCLGEWAIAISLSLMLPLMLIVTRLTSNYYLNRYSVGWTLGVSLLAGSISASLDKRLFWFHSVSAGLLTYLVPVALSLWWFAGQNHPIVGLQRDPLFRRAPNDLPLVIADPLRYSPTWWYLSQERKSTNLHCLSDLQNASRTPDLVPEYSLSLEQPFGAPPLDDYATFTRDHHKFFLYVMDDNYAPEWVEARLRQEGWKLVLMDLEGTHRLYRVSAPS